MSWYTLFTICFKFQLVVASIGQYIFTMKDGAVLPDLVLRMTQALWVGWRDCGITAPAGQRN